MLAMGLLQRFKRDQPTPLQADLKAVTESNVIEPPKETINMVVEATKLGMDERREIMLHLRECLAEPQTKRWRRMYAGLVLTEQLLKSAAPELMVETSEGHYFDLIQRLSLLETWECTTDLRVQNMVRTKAAALRAEVIPKLGSAETDAPPKSPADSKGDRDLTSDNHSSMSGTSTAASNSSKNGFAGYVTKPESQMILNGIVAVGHNDDTDSDGDDEGNAKAVAYRKTKQPPVAPAAPVATQSRNTESTAAIVSSKPAEVDLLDL